MATQRAPESMNDLVTTRRLLEQSRLDHEETLRLQYRTIATNLASLEELRQQRLQYTELSARYQTCQDQLRRADRAVREAAAKASELERLVMAMETQPSSTESGPQRVYRFSTMKRLFREIRDLPYLATPPLYRESANPSPPAPSPPMSDLAGPVQDYSEPTPSWFRRQTARLIRRRSS